jgi:hypothetical protein
MKVTLTSPSRELFGILVRQQTENSFLSLSDLQAAYDRAAKEFGWGEKRVDHFFRSTENHERLYELMLAQGKVDVQFCTFTEGLSKSPATYMKSLGLWKTTRADGVFVDPYVFVAIALWINPKIYARTVIWLTDKLIFNRIAAGARYRPMTDAIQKHIEPTISEDEKRFLYQNETNMINEIVFGQKGKDLRNGATEKQLIIIEELERANTRFIQAGVLDMGTRRKMLKGVYLQEVEIQKKLRK